jgi:CheY-like chemotaxis protein
MPAPIHILLVDDSPADVRLAQEALKEFNLQNQLTVLSDGEDALAYLRRQGRFADAPTPDLVLLDLGLPKVDGLEVLAEISKDAELHSIPVALLIVSDTDRHLAQSAGVKVDCFVNKPLTPEKCLEALRCFPQFGFSIVRVSLLRPEAC